MSAFARFVGDGWISGSDSSLSVSKTFSLFLEGDSFWYVVSESMHKTDDKRLAVVVAEG